MENWILTDNSWLLSDVPVSSVLWWLLAVAAVIFAVHALVVMYHWFIFGTERIVPLLATVIYVGVGGVLLLSMLSVVAFM